MATVWLLLLFVLSFHSVHGQDSLDDDETYDEDEPCTDGGLFGKLETDIETILANQLQLLEGQQELLQSTEDCYCDGTPGTGTRYY